MHTQEQSTAAKTEPTKTELPFIIKSVLKRDGKEAPFAKEKILAGISKAAQEAGEESQEKETPKDLMNAKIQLKKVELLPMKQGKVLKNVLVGVLFQKIIFYPRKKRRKN